MSAIIEMRDGYGWAIGTSTLKADVDGWYFDVDTDSENPVKTIYVAEQKIAPVYIFWQCRVYATSAVDYLTYTTVGLVQGDVTSEVIAIASGASTLITVEGYTVSSTVTITFAGDATDTYKIYPMNETGI